MNIAELVMNSVRQRILQYILLNKSATVNDLSAALSDVPKPSIYRHVRILFENGVIVVSNEKKIRGTIEKTYSLAEPNSAGSEEDVSSVIQNYLLKLMMTFSAYFKSENPQPEKDMLCVGGVTLMLTDEQMMNFLQDYSKLISKAMEIKPNENSKPRSMTLISAPKIDE